MIHNDEQLRQLFAQRLDEAMSENPETREKHGRAAYIMKNIDGSISQRGALNWVNGEKMPRGEAMLALAKLVGVNHIWLRDGVGPKYGSEVYVAEDSSKYRMIPVIRAAEAGTYEQVLAGGKQADMWPVRPSLNARSAKLIWVEADDSSMDSQTSRKALRAGDYALIELGLAPSPGDVVLCLPPNSTSGLLRVYREKGGGNFELYPINEDWASISDASGYSILGVMIESLLMA